MAEVAEESPTYACPVCQSQVQIDSVSEPFVRCPVCGEEFTLPVEIIDVELPVPLDPPEGLDSRRIRQIVVQRSADIRLRSYFLICAMGCFALAIVYVYRIGIRWSYRLPWSGVDATYIAIVIAAMIGTGYLVSRAHRLTRELNKPLLHDPTTPPDFSDLGDGSQQAKALEDLEPQMNTDEHG